MIERLPCTTTKEELQRIKNDCVGRIYLPLSVEMVILLCDTALAYLERTPSEGWVLVPKEPTIEMQDAIINKIGSGVVEAYWAMIAAAPKTEEK